jgi:hypothetical protein
MTTVSGRIPVSKVPRNIWRYSENRLRPGWENIENVYTNLGHLVKEMEAIRTTFSEDVAVREERLHYQRKRIEAFLNAIVRVLAKLKYDLDKNLAVGQKKLNRVLQAMGKKSFLPSLNASG